MRIPSGSAFGNEIARYGPTPVASNLDGGVGAAVGRLGELGTNVAVQQMADNQRAAEIERRQAEQDAKEQARVRAAADRAQAGEAIATNREALDSLHQQFDADIQTGQVDKTKALAQFREQAGKLIDTGLQDVPADYAGHVRADLTVRAARLEGKVNQSVMRRDRSDIAAGIDTTLEYAQRLSTTDPAMGRQVGLDAIRELGPFAGIPPEQLAKKAQKFVEDVSYTRAYTAIYTARDNTPMLQAADKQIAADPDMDPQKKATLLASSSGFQASNAQRAEAAAARAERQQEAKLKRAEAEFNAFQAVSDKGGYIDPAYADRVSQATAGTPYQAGIKALADQAVQTGGLAVQPIPQQRAALQAIDTQIQATGRNPELDKRRSAIAKVLSASETDVKSDPMSAALERGVVPALAPIDTSSPNALAASITQRLTQAQTVQQWAGANVSPLTNAEAEKVQSALAVMPAKAKSEAIAAISTQLGPRQSAGLAKQLDPRDKALALAFASAGSATDPATTSFGTPIGQGRYASELILKGAAAEKDGTSTKGEKVPGVKAATWKANIAAQLDGVYSSQSTTDNAAAAALYIAHGMAAEHGGDMNKDMLNAAVGLAIGGKLEELNGRKIALPAGIELSQVEKRLETMSPDEIQRQAGGPTVRAGGVDVPVADFTRKLPGAELMFAGPGRYMVIVNGRPVVGAGNKPIMIGVQ